MKWPILRAFPSFSPRYLRPFIRLCAQQSALSVGKKLHALILTTGLSKTQNSFLLNTLLHFYALCGDILSARKLFDEIPHSSKDIADWTALMSSFSRQNKPHDALRLFAQMLENGVEIDDVVMVCLFSACAWLRDVGMGIQGHGYVVKMGFEGQVKLCNAVMDMYGKCGMMGEMRRVFSEMKEKNVVSWTVVLDGVLKWVDVRSGRLVFDEMPERNEVAWTIMIAGYVGSGFSKESFSLLREMVFRWGFKLNYITLCSLLSASAQSGDVVMGRWIHVYGLKTMGIMEMDIKVGTAMVDMYAKCGRIDTAAKVFECMPRRNVVAWNAMLSGLAMHGRGRVAVDMFPRMVEEVRPDDLTFIAVLSACSHSGLIDQGSYYFDRLESVYGITPMIDHYACMVDLLGRAGRLEEAETLINQMPIPPNEVVLGSLLGSCNSHGKLQLAERVLQKLVEMNPCNTEYHILLSNMYALTGKRDKANALRKVLKTKGIRKVPGMSSIHVDGHVHQFSAGDKSHPKTQEIYVMLGDMVQRLRSAGYVPNPASQVFSGSDSKEDNAMDLEEKEQAVFSHSEKLAVCFGLVSTKPGTPLYVFKNLRICQDCHAALKIVSKVYNREIVVRDRNRFHCFKQGSCSCFDFW